MNGFDEFIIWLGVGGYVAFGAGAAIILLRAGRRPPTADDIRYAAIDEELTAAEHARRRVL